MKRFIVLLLLSLAAPLAGCRADEEFTIDPSKIVTDTNVPPANLAAEVARAKSENKLLLLEFGSSDACPPCILLQQKVFSTPEFQAFSKTNLDFVRLDFPLKANLRPDTVATNTLLAQQYKAYGFPTFVALDKNGNEFWRMPEGDEDGIAIKLFDPINFITLINNVKKSEP